MTSRIRFACLILAMALHGMTVRTVAAKPALNLLPWPASVECLSGEYDMTSNAVVLTKSDPSIEGYILDVNPSGITITAADSVNVFYATQTLGQLTATLHITQPARKPLLQAHALAEEVERRLLTELPRLRRVVVHVEPPE